MAWILSSESNTLHVSHWDRLYIRFRKRGKRKGWWVMVWRRSDLFPRRLGGPYATEVAAIRIVRFVFHEMAEDRWGAIHIQKPVKEEETA